MTDPALHPAPAAPPADPAAAPLAARRDMIHGLRLFLSLDAAARLLIWAGAFAATTALFTTLHLWPMVPLVGASPRQAVEWAGGLALWILVFNNLYVLELLILRLLVPTPREGRYPLAGRVPRPVVWSCLVAVLTKARLEAPFPGFLVFHLANLPPLVWLMGPAFGPRSRSCYVADPHVIDPHLVTLGRNVVIGLNTTVAGHYQERNAVVFARTVIEDEAVIGGHAVIFGGVRVGRGAMIGAGAIVLPRTVIGPNEFWAGVPARKLRDLPPLESTPTAE